MSRACSLDLNWTKAFATAQEYFPLSFITVTFDSINVELCWLGISVWSRNHWYLNMMCFICEWHNKIMVSPSKNGREFDNILSVGLSSTGKQRKYCKICKSSLKLWTSQFVVCTQTRYLRLISKFIAVELLSLFFLIWDFSNQVRRSCTSSRARPTKKHFSTET